MKVLFVIAHADDEIVVGWPLLQDPNIEKAILLCSTDANNPKRSWCKNRKYTFEKVCKQLDIKVYKWLDYNSEFYRMETRKESLSNMLNDVMNNIELIKKEFDFDYIFTHNSDGEYGHIDHQLLSNLVIRSEYNTILTDMFICSNWVPYNHKRYFSLDYTSKKSVDIDINFYNKIKKIYEDAGVWTWNTPPVNKCNVIFINKENNK